MSFEIMKKNIETIHPLDTGMLPEIEAKINQLTKPPGSLGKLEEYAKKLCLIYGDTSARIEQPAVVVMAADHGITDEGISAFPSDVTRQMVLNFLSDGAAINVFSKLAGANVFVIDMGVKGEPIEHPNLTKRSIRPGTANFLKAPAMKERDAILGLTAGMDFAENLIREGYDIFVPGEMGIGNTTSASAITSVICGKSVPEVVGRGTGIANDAKQKKISVIEKSIELHQPNPNDPIDILMKIGGFEIAGLTGLMLTAASYGKPIILDGFISTSAGLLASLFSKDVSSYFFAGHISQEPGHASQLEYLGLEPILNLDMRLGEGTGGVLSLFILKAALKMLNEMATFESAGVSECT